MYVPFVDKAPIVNSMLQDQFAIPVQVNIDDFDLRFILNDVELVGKICTNGPITMFVMNGLYQKVRFPVIVKIEKLHFSDKVRAEILSYETFIPMVRPGILQSPNPILAAGKFRVPGFILIGRMFADTFNVLH